MADVLLREKLLEIQKKLNEEKEGAIELEYAANKEMDAAKTAGAPADYERALGKAKDANDEINRLNELLRQKSTANKELMRKMAENPKSSACVLQ